MSLKCGEKPKGRKYADLCGDDGVGFSRRFTGRWGHAAKFVVGLGSWIVWDGLHWRPDGNGQAIRWAIETLDYAEQRDLALVMAKWSVTTFDSGADDSGHDMRMVEGEDAALDRQERKTLAAKEWGRLLSFFKKAREPHRVTSMLASFAATAPGMHLEVEELDADPWLLGTANGVLELKTGTLRDTRIGDYITKPVAIDYNPSAPRVAWEAFLKQILPDPEVRHYIKKTIGYSATGSTREQKLFVAVGEGANGKSVFLNVAARVLGPNAGHIASKTIINRRSDAHSADLATLIGKRMVITAEPARGGLSEDLVKAVTGSDPITANRMRMDPTTFKPKFTLFLAANDWLSVRGADHGIWRRLLPIPFEVTIPEAEQKRDLEDELFEGEAAGILAWVIEGCLEYQAEGLAPPEAINQAGEMWREDSDPTPRFLHAVFDYGPRELIEERLHKDLYKLAKAWWFDEGRDDVPDNYTFGKMLNHAGVQLKKRRDGQYRCVPQLKAEWAHVIREDDGAPLRRIPWAGEG